MRRRVLQSISDFLTKPSKPLPADSKPLPADSKPLPTGAKDTSPDAKFKYQQYTFLNSEDDLAVSEAKHNADDQSMPLQMHSTHQQKACIFTNYQVDSLSGPTTADFKRRLNSLYQASLAAITQHASDVSDDAVKLVKQQAELFFEQASEFINTHANIDQTSFLKDGGVFLPIERDRKDEQQDELLADTALKRALEGASMGPILAGSWHSRWNRLKDAIVKTYRLPNQSQVHLNNVDAAKNICGDYLSKLVTFANQQQIPLTVKDIQRAEPIVVENEGWPALFNCYQLSSSNPDNSNPQQVFSYSEPVGERGVPSTNRTGEDVVNFRKVVVGCVNKGDGNSQAELKPLFTGYRHGSLLPIGKKGSASADVKSAKVVLLKFLQQVCKDLGPNDVEKANEKKKVRVLLLGLLSYEKRWLQSIIDTVTSECSGRRQIEASATAVRQIDGGTLKTIVTELRSQGEMVFDFKEFGDDVQLDLAFLNVPTNPFSLKAIRSDEFDAVNAAAMKKYAGWMGEHINTLFDNVMEDKFDGSDADLNLEGIKLEGIKTDLLKKLQEVIELRQKPDKNSLSTLLTRIGGVRDNQQIGRDTPRRKLINFCQLVIEMFMAYAEDPAEQAIVNGCQLQVLLLLIAQEMGVVKSAHCKSGEDRTGVVMAQVELWSLLREQDPTGNFPLRWQLDEWIDDSDGTLTPAARRYVQQAQQVFKYSTNRPITDANVPGAGQLQIQTVMPMFSLFSSPACMAMAKSAKAVFGHAQKTLGWSGRLRILINRLRVAWRQWRGSHQAYQLLPTDEPLPKGQQQEVERVDESESLSNRRATSLHQPQVAEEDSSRPRELPITNTTLSPDDYDKTTASPLAHDTRGKVHTEQSKAAGRFSAHRQPTTDEYAEIRKENDTDSSREERRWRHTQPLFTERRRASLSTQRPTGEPLSNARTTKAELYLGHQRILEAQQLLNTSGDTTSQPTSGERDYPEQLQDVCQVINTRWRDNRSNGESQSDETVVEVRKRNNRTMVILSDALVETTAQTADSLPAASTDEAAQASQTLQAELVRLCVLTLLNNGVAPVDDVYQTETQDGPAKSPVLKLTIGRKFNQPEMVRKVFLVISAIQETLNKVNSSSEQAMPVTLKITDKRDQIPRSWTCSGEKDERAQELQKLLGCKSDSSPSLNDDSLQQDIETVFKEFDWPVSTASTHPTLTIG